jgi:large subunit ribosomal protein L6
MSKIGKKIIIIPSQVTVSMADRQLTAKGPKGTLQLSILPNIEVKIEGNKISLTRSNEEKQTKANHGLMRSLMPTH